MFAQLDTRHSRYNPASSSAKKTISGASCATSISFFRVVLQNQPPGLAARLENLLGLLVTEPAQTQQATVRSTAMVLNTMFLSNDQCQVFHAPELPIGGTGFWPQSLFGCVLKQHLLQFFYLQLAQFGTITTGSFVDQPLRGIGSVRPTPFHQAGSTSSGDLLNLVDRVAFIAETNSLVACACSYIFACPVGS